MEEIFCEIERIANAAANTIASPSWADKIDIIISIISALISLAAVVVAGYVARKQIGIAKKQNLIAEEQAKISKMQTNIADKQNKIALFEKRYELYKVVLSCSFFEEYLLKCAEEPSDAYKIIGLAFNVNLTGEAEDKERVSSHISTKIEILKQAEFLFSENTSNQINKLARDLLVFVNIDIFQIDSEKFNKLKEDFHKEFKAFRETGCLEDIEAQLQLQ